MNKKHSLLLVDDEKKILDILNINFSKDYNVFLAKNGIEALTILDTYPIDVIVSDLRMPEMDGKELLDFTRKEFPSIPFIIVTAYGTIEDAVESIKKGAFDYILKPIKIEELKHKIEKALSLNALLHENEELKTKIKSLESSKKIVTVDPEMKKLLNIAEQVAKTNATVLITGETGTGKQLFAEYIHNKSMVANGPFVEINAGAIPQELLESELFGYEKGAFTGAVKTKKGKFELADNGTLFIDEIGEMPISQQVKLLHAVEQNKITRVGGTKEIPVNVRLITATNRNLKEEVEKGNFRKDLFYRLSVVTLKLLPLRDRKADIPVLVEYFIKKYSSSDIKVEDEVMSLFLNYSWPGNIRELENVIQQAVIFAKNGVITKYQVSEDIINQSFSIPLNKDEFQRLKKDKVDIIASKLEIQYLNNLLKQTGGNITKAAALSGYNRRQLQNLISKHNINPRNFKK